MTSHDQSIAYKCELSLECVLVTTELDLESCASMTHL